MIYSIIGNLIGTSYNNESLSLQKGESSSHTILMVATIEHLLTKKPLILCIRKWNNKYPNITHGYNFNNWIYNNEAYNSFGNLGLIRTIPYIYYYKDLNDILKHSIDNTLLSHYNKEALKGTEVLMRAIYIVKNGNSKEDLYKEIKKYYNLNFHIGDIIEKYKHEPTCQNTIPQSIVCFLESSSYEDSIIKCLKLGGDIRTNCVIVSTLSSLYYKKIDLKFTRYYYNSISEDIIKLINRFIEKC